MTAPWLQPLPLIAILRGLRPDEAISVGSAIVDAGFHLLREHLGDRCLVGAGTVMSVAQVEEIAAAGGQLIVMPHVNANVIAAARRAGLFCVPGVATITEAFAALAAGADALKIFPIDQVGPAVVKAWRAVLPPGLALLPVGGITPDNMDVHMAVGVSGFGLGSALYAPGVAAAEVGRRAHAFAKAWAMLQRGKQA